MVPIPPTVSSLSQPVPMVLWEIPNGSMTEKEKTKSSLQIILYNMPEVPLESRQLQYYSPFLDIPEEQWKELLSVEAAPGCALCL